MNDELYIQVTDENLGMMINRKATKLNGIRTICKNLNIPLSNVVAFGDDLNDIEMIKECGIGVAVSNALQSVKIAADEICNSNEQDGVAEWIGKALLFR